MPTPMTGAAATAGGRRSGVADADALAARLPAPVAGPRPARRAHACWRSPCPSNWPRRAWRGCHRSPASTPSSPARSPSPCWARPRSCRWAPTPPSPRSSRRGSPTSRRSGRRTMWHWCRCWPSWWACWWRSSACCGLGWIADFLSAPIITGFLAGVAIIIVGAPTPRPSRTALGVGRHGAPRGGGGSDTSRHVNGLSVLISVAVFAVVMAAEHIDRKFPGALLGLVGSTLVVAAAAICAPTVWRCSAPSPISAPHVGVSDLSWSSLGPGRRPSRAWWPSSYSARPPPPRAPSPTRAAYKVDVNRDFVGVGAGGIVAGLAGAFATNASPARTGAVAVSGRAHPTGRAWPPRPAWCSLIPAAGLLTDVPAGHAGRHPHLRGHTDVPRRRSWRRCCASTAGSSASPS